MVQSRKAPMFFKLNLKEEKKGGSEEGKKDEQKARQKDLQLTATSADSYWALPFVRLQAIPLPVIEPSSDNNLS